jgi:hypothetical protein
MFGLLYLAFVIGYFVIAWIIGACIEKGTILRRTFAVFVFLFPVWFFAGHIFYPSHFEFMSLCENATFDSNKQNSNLKTKYKRSWVIKSRLQKSSKFYIDSFGKPVAEYTDYKYYPYGADFKFIGAGGGYTPSKTCPIPTKTN